MSKLEETIMFQKVFTSKEGQRAFCQRCIDNFFEFISSDIFNGQIDKNYLDAIMYCNNELKRLV